MGQKVAKLSQKLAEQVGLARVYVPAHVRVVKGKTQNVDGYWREMRPGQVATVTTKEGHELEVRSGSSGHFGPIKTFRRPDGMEIKRGRAYQWESGDRVYTGTFSGVLSDQGNPAMQDVSIFDRRTGDRQTPSYGVQMTPDSQPLTLEEADRRVREAAEAAGMSPVEYLRAEREREFGAAS